MVTTIYRSAPFLARFVEKTVTAITEAGIDNYEIVFVDDGSPDQSNDLLLRTRASNPNIKVADLPRNFGHHKAMLAGLSYAKANWFSSSTVISKLGPANCNASWAR